MFRSQADHRQGVHIILKSTSKGVVVHIRICVDTSSIFVYTSSFKIGLKVHMFKIVKNHINFLAKLERRGVHKN
jgi:hypothetical protein